MQEDGILILMQERIWTQVVMRTWNILLPRLQLAAKRT